VARRKSKRSLFEVMNRAVEPVPTRITPTVRAEGRASVGWWEHWRARRAERRAAAEARLSSRQRADEAFEAPPIRHGAKADDTPDRPSDGRWTISLNTVTCMVAAAGLCMLVLVAYSVGRKAGSKGQPVPARALAPATNPLLPVNASPRQPTEVERRTGIDLSGLLDQPPAVKPSPTKADEASDRAAAGSPALAETDKRPLQYLCIQTFRTGRGMDRRDLLAEVEDVRRFLASRGVETHYRVTDNGFVLLSRRTFDRAGSQEFKSFANQIERYGEEYRKSGGRYTFKGCYAVSETNLPGKPPGAS
jgi:hypothetical protein